MCKISHYFQKIPTKETIYIHKSHTFVVSFICKHTFFISFADCIPVCSLTRTKKVTLLQHFLYEKKGKTVYGGTDIKDY